MVLGRDGGVHGRFKIRSHLHVLILSDTAGLLGGCAGQTDWGHAGK